MTQADKEYLFLLMVQSVSIHNDLLKAARDHMQTGNSEQAMAALEAAEMMYKTLKNIFNLLNTNYGTQHTDVTPTKANS